MLYSALYLSIGFDLQDFIHATSYEKVELCRKDDLLSIEAHFHIPVKKKIMSTILEKLVELNILTDPDVSDDDAPSVELGVSHLKEEGNSSIHFNSI